MIGLDHLADQASAPTTGMFNCTPSSRPTLMEMEAAKSLVP